ncbi:hypothetical protein BDN70DRAFT_872249 [Pholiota conissans]|uniref:Nuclear condensin complex subunit 3 C-terminal domain-containing protein n=1 Tax=Pholiota conissans TaxID=109636 RepID=A0A9P5ZD31_9AGAR|nr:hypothetical protein BDN70DRAFT_872249 [Pholiota conissans]
MAQRSLPTPHVMREQFELSISRIFDQVQASLSNHRKNFVALNKVHMEAAAYTEETPRGIKIIGETQFQKVFHSFLLRALPMKKGLPAADRVLKFIGGYIRYMNEKALLERDPEDVEDSDNTPAYRFTRFLLEFLMDGFLAKDKTVRYRVLYTLQGMITHLGAIDEESYNSLRDGLMGRVHDKEVSIRALAATCLSILARSETPSEIEDNMSILDTLIEIMTYDSSPEVRRAVIMNIPLNTRSLPAILERTRDEDQPIRKLVFGQILKNNVLENEDGEENVRRIGPTHPRTLTIAQRELIVKNGMGDRDTVVRKATELLISTWMDSSNVKIEEQDVEIEDQPEELRESGPLALLRLFDLNSDLSVAKIALMSIFTTRPVIFNEAKFSAEYWKDLTPEKAFFARVYVDYCKETKDEARLEAVPVVTFVAFQIQDKFNAYIDFSTTHDGLKSPLNPDIDTLQSDEEKISRLLVISELLKLAANLDYSDETGRRKTFKLVRHMLESEVLPEVLMAPCLDVLRVLSVSERDLIRLVVEIVSELRDNILCEDIDNPLGEPAVQSFNETTSTRLSRSCTDDLSPEKKERLDVIDLRCLKMCIGMLERVDTTFEDNIILDGLLRELIIPSTHRDGIFLEQGIKALGLCCLIARTMAVQSFRRFMGFFSSSPPGIRLILVHSLIDIFMVHENAIFNDGSNNLQMTTQFLLLHTVEEQDPKVQATLCQGMAKLVISGLITDIEVLKTLLKIYISPSSGRNDELRQCLTVFFRIYSHSSASNQHQMRKIFLLIFLDICEDRKASIESEDDIEVIGSSQLASMFIEWTDPLHLAQALATRQLIDGQVADECIQLDMAKDIITLLFEKDLKVEIEKEDKRVLCQLLNKMYIPDTVDEYRIRSLKLLMINLRTRRPLRDTICKTALAKFEATITKKFEKQLEHFSEEEFRKLAELQELFLFLDSIIPEDDIELTEIDIPRTRGRKRRSESMISTTTGSRSNSAGPSTDKIKSKSKYRSKHPRLSTEDDEDVTAEGTPQPEAPTRAIPKRAAASRKKPPVIVISSDSEEHNEAPEKNGKNTGARFRPAIKEEAQLDKDLDNLLDNSGSSSLSEVPFDSIMDSDPDSEDEVNNLLAEE